MKWSVQPDGRLVPVTLQGLIDDSEVVRADVLATIDYADSTCRRAREVVTQARRVRYVSQLTRQAVSSARRIH